jgi:hypothetical protein
MKQTKIRSSTHNLASADNLHKIQRQKVRSPQEECYDQVEQTRVDCANNKSATYKIPGNIQKVQSKSTKKNGHLQIKDKSFEKSKSRTSKPKKLSKENFISHLDDLPPKNEPYNSTRTKKKVVSAKPMISHTNSKTYKKSAKDSSVKFFQSPQANSNLNLHMNFFNLQGKHLAEGSAFIVQPTLSPLIPMGQQRKTCSAFEAQEENTLNAARFMEKGQTVNGAKVKIKKKKQLTSKGCDEVHVQAHRVTSKNRIFETEIENVTHKPKSKSTTKIAKKNKHSESLKGSTDLRLTNSREMKPRKSNLKFKDPQMIKNFINTSPTISKYQKNIQKLQQASPSNQSKRESDISERQNRRSENCFDYESQSVEDSELHIEISKNRNNIKPEHINSNKSGKRVKNLKHKIPHEKNVANANDRKINIGKLIASRHSEKSLQGSDSRPLLSTENHVESNFAKKEYLKWKEMEKMIVSFRQKFNTTENDQTVFECLIKMLNCAQNSKKEMKKAIELQNPDPISSTNRAFPASSKRQQIINASAIQTEISKIELSKFIHNKLSSINDLDNNADKINRSDLKDIQILKNESALQDPNPKSITFEKNKLELVKSQNYFYRPKDKNLLIIEAGKEVGRNDKSKSYQQSIEHSKEFSKNCASEQQAKPALNNFWKANNNDSYGFAEENNQPPHLISSFDKANDRPGNTISKNSKLISSLAFRKTTPLKAVPQIVINGFKREEAFLSPGSKNEKMINNSIEEALISSAVACKDNLTSNRNTEKCNSNREIVELWASPKKSFDMISEEVDQLNDSNLFKPNRRLMKVKAQARENARLQKFPSMLSHLNRLSESFITSDRLNRPDEHENLQLSAYMDKHLLKSLKDFDFIAKPDFHFNSKSKNAILPECKSDSKQIISRSLNLIENTIHKDSLKKPVNTKIDFSSPLKTDILVSKINSGSKRSVRMMSNLREATSSSVQANEIRMHLSELQPLPNMPSLEFAPLDFGRQNEFGQKSDIENNSLNQRALADILENFSKNENVISANNHSNEKNGNRHVKGNLLSFNLDLVNLPPLQANLIEPSLSFYTEFPKLNFFSDSNETITIQNNDRKINGLVEAVLDEVVVGILNDSSFSIYLHRFIEKKIGSLSDIIEMRSSDMYNQQLSSLSSQFMCNESNPYDLSVNPHICEKNEEFEDGKNFQHLIERQVDEILNESTETVYAIRTHFKAINEYLNLVLNHFMSIDNWPVIVLLGQNDSYSSSGYFFNKIFKTPEAMKTNKYLEDQLIDSSAIKDEFEVIEAHITVF